MGFSNSIEYIGDSAFEGCISLSEINLPDKYIEMSSSSFFNTGYYNNPENWDGNILYLDKKVIDVSGIDPIIRIKDGVSSIVGGTLKGKEVFIPESVVNISEDAFTDKTDVTIFGYSDTYAQEYANKQNIRFIDLNSLILGDVNSDGKLDTDDYKILCDVTTTQKTPSFIIKIAGDMDSDGAIDGTDVIILDLILNNMPPSRLKGDVNGDNKVDINDYDLLVNIVSTGEKITDNVMFIRADINEDGAVDSYDAVYLDLALNGMIALV